MSTTISGNLTRDPELRFTQSGKPVANFTVAHTARRFSNGEWVDGDTLFLDCSIWGKPAENVAETLRKGDRVIVTGDLTQRSFETKDGQKRTVIELKVQDIGTSLISQRRETARGRGDEPPF